MQFTLSLAVLTALTTSVSATPLPNKRANNAGRFSVQQRVSGTKRLGQVAHRRTYLKYGVAVPDHIHVAAVNALSAVSTVKAAGNGTGSEAATPFQQDAEYLSSVTVGGTEMMLDLDTGSSDLWVVSSLQSSSDTTGHAVYKADSANELQGATWEISYGDGSGASGNVYTGTVEIGGVTATKQAIEAATSMSAQFLQDADSDGLMGLGFASINQVQPTPQKPFFDNVKGQLDSPLFTATLKHDTPGTYDFGFIDDSKYTGKINYVDVDSSNGFWQFVGDGYAVGDGQTTSSQFDAILDTGSSLFYMPTEAVTAYYSQISSAQENQLQGGYTFDCSETLPDMSVVIAGTKYTVPGTLLNYAEASQGTCFGGLQDSQGLPYNILGDVFLKAVFAVFDTDGPKIGLAPQSGSSSNSSSTGGGSSSSGSASSSSAPANTPTPTLAPTSTAAAPTESPVFSVQPSATVGDSPVTTITLTPDGSGGFNLPSSGEDGGFDLSSIFGSSSSGGADSSNADSWAELFGLENSKRRAQEYRRRKAVPWRPQAQ